MRNFINHFSWKKKLTNYIVLPLFEHNGFLEFISSVVFHHHLGQKLYRKSFISIFQMSLRFPRGLLFVRRTLCWKSNCCPKIQFWQKLYFQAYLNFSAQNWKIFFKKVSKFEFLDQSGVLEQCVFCLFVLSRQPYFIRIQLSAPYFSSLSLYELKQKDWHEEGGERSKATSRNVGSPESMRDERRFVNIKPGKKSAGHAVFST